MTLTRLCKALGWPRLRRWADAIERIREVEQAAAAAERRADAVISEAPPATPPAPGPEPVTDPAAYVTAIELARRDNEARGRRRAPGASQGFGLAERLGYVWRDVPNPYFRLVDAPRDQKADNREGWWESSPQIPVITAAEADAVLAGIRAPAER